MCVVSMIYDRYGDKWSQPPYQPSPSIPTLPAPPPLPNPTVVPYVPLPGWPPPTPPQKPLTQDELEELREWLRRAREYDERTGQPDCESESKKERLKKIIRGLAKEGDIDISFLDEEN